MMWNKRKEAAPVKGCCGFIPVEALLEYFHTCISPLMFLELKLDSQFIFILGAMMITFQM